MARGGQQPLKVHLVVLGNGFVGKTAILHQFFHKTFTDKYRETVEDLFRTRYLLNNTLIDLEALDMAGNISFPAMRRLRMATADAFLLVFSLMDRASFEHVKALFDEIADVRASELSSIPIIIAGNKLDIVDSAEEEHLRQVSKEEAEEYASSKEIYCKIQYMEVSARLGNNIQEIFQAFARLSGLASLAAAGVSNHKETAQEKSVLSLATRRRMSEQALMLPSTKKTSTMSPNTARKISFPGLLQRKTPGSPSSNKKGRSKSLEDGVIECAMQ